MPHQEKFLRDFSDRPGFALFWEQGTGKTAPLIHEAVNKFADKTIGIHLIAGPANIVDNWITDEYPIHAPREFLDRALFFRYQASKAKTKKTHALWREARETDRPVVLTIGYDALTGNALPQLRELLREKPYGFCMDETRHCKDPSSVRAQVLLGSRHMPGGLVGPAVYRRVACGTPTSGSPFDFYSQIELAIPGFWKSKGLGNFFAFKRRYGVYEIGYAAGGRKFDKLVSYKNISQLRGYIQEVSWRLLKSEVLADLPPKVYMHGFFFDLSNYEREMYNNIESGMRIELADRELTLANALVVSTKLRQVSSGFVYSDDSHTNFLGPTPSRLKALGQLLESLDNPDAPMIIWAEFQPEAEMIKSFLASTSRRVVVYRGSDDDKLRARQGFQSGDFNTFIASPAMCGEGVTLTKAEVVVYYSHGLKLIERLQSEDRAHRKGLNHPVLYYDLLARNSYDDRLMEIRRERRAMANQLLEANYEDIRDPLMETENLAYVLFGDTK